MKQDKIAPMEPTVFLFDLDGVLVRPGGYRASVRATVNYFAAQLGLGDIAPDDDTIAIFEAEGITCEWDMVPILVALSIDAVMARSQGQVMLQSFQAACDWVHQQNVEELSFDFAPLIRGLGRYVRPGTAPAETILAAVRSGQADHLLAHLAEQPVLEELLSHTRHLAHSRTSAVFEAFALGDAAFLQSTGLQSEIRSASFLAGLDHPLIFPEIRDRLIVLRDQAGLRMSAYTARPSAPSGPFDEPLAVCAPEAEMALACIGWSDLTLVGSGQMGEVAWKLHENEDRLTKPAPYHAIAAVASAWTGNRPAAMAWTEQVFSYFEDNHASRSGQKPALQVGSVVLPAQLRLDIFEDSKAGMLGGKHACELLSELGLQVSLNLWGIASHPEKVAALRAIGARVFPDINQAINHALSQ